MGTEHEIHPDLTTLSNHKSTSAMLGQSHEITVLGMIAALIVTFGALVNDGTLPLSDYLVFLSFMLTGAGVLLWRMWKRIHLR